MVHVKDMKGLCQARQVPKKDIGDKQMKKLLGIVFLVAAATVLYFGSIGWPSLDVNLWSLIPVGLFLFFTLENLLKKRSFYYPKFIKFFWRAGFLLTLVMYIEMIVELMAQK